jgi:hypothetical protein
VHVDDVADPGVQGRHREGLSVRDEGQVTDERGVEHGVDGAAVIDASLRLPAYPGVASQRRCN